MIAALLVTIQKDLTYASVTAATLEMGAPAEVQSYIESIP